MPKIDLSKLISAGEKRARAEDEEATRASGRRRQEALADLRRTPLPPTPSNVQFAARLRLIEQALGIG